MMIQVLLINTIHLSLNVSRMDKHYANSDVKLHFIENLSKQTQIALIVMFMNNIKARLAIKSINKAICVLPPISKVDFDVNCKMLKAQVISLAKSNTVLNTY